MEEADNLLLILTGAKEALIANDPYKLKILSDQTVHSAAIYQDADNIIVAVIVYSLGKIIEREGYRRTAGWELFYKSLMKNLDSAIFSLEKKDEEKFLNSLGLIRESITNIEGDLSTYIKDIFYKAGINKAFKLYEHGLSSGKTASLLGISLWDLAGYIGQSTVSESHLNEALPIRERIKNARQIMNVKNVILDAGPLISMTLTGTLFILERLKKRFPEIEFIMTPQVKEETIGKAWNVKKYELEAVKLQTLIDKGVIKLASTFMDVSQIEKETARILNLANSVYKADGEFLKLIQIGEASCLAFANLCKCQNLIVVDERTVRLFSESPINLKTITERKMHMPVSLNMKNVKEFSKFSFIRSSELLFLAYELDLLDYKKDKTVLDALLYAVKFSGTSISSKEIEEMKSLIM
ncbi:hypothetical protein KA107_00790 [Candidatus Pacearchaeota archaeon]|nr:hypothetical protein [Candidatus Pacearchaeota archaeon]